MARDHRKLRVFKMADSLIVDIYKETRGFPDDERYGLRSQIRRAAVSTAANIVEGSARKREREYCNFLNIAAGSASEMQYLVDLAGRLGYLTGAATRDFPPRCHELVASLIKLVDSFGPEARSLKPEA